MPYRECKIDKSITASQLHRSGKSLCVFAQHSKWGRVFLFRPNGDDEAVCYWMGSKKRRRKKRSCPVEERGAKENESLP